ncbi:MAG: glycosyltransferase family 2 protein, partial [Deltaproteobacteria bacterium]
RAMEDKRGGQIFAACAAGAMYRRDMIDLIGFFDEDFFMQCEDTDLSFRAQLAGWKVIYAPGARVFHKVGHSIGRATDFNVYHTQRNIEFVRIKNVPASLLMLYLPQMLVNLLVDFLYFGIKNRRWRAFIRAKRDAVTALPRFLAKRKTIMREIKKVKASYVRSIITPLLSEDNKNLFAIKLKKFFL